MRRTSLATLVAAAVLLTGCSGSDDDPQADPSGTPSEGTSTEPAPSEPSVEPATGALLDLERVRMHAPEGWKKQDPLATFLLQAVDPESVSNVSLSDLSAVSDTPLEGQARIAVKHYPRAEIVEPVEIAGVDWYHITGPANRLSTVDLFGTIHNGSEAVIDFSFDNDVADDEQQRIIDSVLASVEWK